MAEQPLHCGVCRLPVHVGATLGRNTSGENLTYLSFNSLRQTDTALMPWPISQTPAIAEVGRRLKPKAGSLFLVFDIRCRKLPSHHLLPLKVCVSRRLTSGAAAGHQTQHSAPGCGILTSIPASSHCVSPRNAPNLHDIFFLKLVMRNMNKTY